ncbi:RICIN domain-containing protein [Streptomyces sp. NPDC050856]|uniref:RICIN domain-containing protein n=1 Tax=Streptomyces sp. NPDC050856 TaxID=3154939 RepID=UPI003404D44E
MAYSRKLSAAPPPPPYAPAFGGSDEGLAGLLGDGRETAREHSEALLTARHWPAVCDHAALFTASRETAATVAAAAFGQVLEELRAGEAGGALRPRLLVAVGRTLRARAGLPRAPELLGILRAPAEPAENRRLVARAFAELPTDAQVLLWHREVEAEGLSVPAVLLAMDPRRAAERLAEARELLRAACARTHARFAPDAECRHYGRLLDISLRRGGTLIPDIQHHLAKCRYCRYAAEQLRRFDGRLAPLLAEALLGEGARGYLESRPARSRPRPLPRRARHSRTGRPGTGWHGTLPRGGPARAGRLRGGRRAGGRPGGELLVGLGIVVTGALLAAAVAVLRAGGGDGGDGGHGAGTGGPSGAVTGTARPPAPPPASAGDPTGPLSTGLRNAGAGLCLDVRDGRPAVGAGLTLAPCTAGAATQRWLYEDDGLLHSAAAPELCPHSREPAGVVVLRLCATRAGTDVRYDLLVRGQVTPRWHQGLALAPVAAAPGTDIVVKVRDGAAAQRWLTDPTGRAPSPGPARGA